MKFFVFISCIAPPEPGVSGATMYNTAKALAQKGNVVYLISPFPSRPINTSYEGFENTKKIISYEQDGIKVVKIPSYTHPGPGLIGRIYESYSFSIESIEFLKNNINNVRLVYALPWPYIGQYILAKYLKKKKIPFINSVQDIYPESFIEKLPNLIKPILIWLMLWVDKQIAFWATHIVVISNNMKDVYIKSRKIPDDKITVIENWLDSSLFTGVRSSPLPNQLDRFPTNHRIYMYLGNIGPVAGIENIIESFHEANLNSATLVIAGSGTTKEKCIRLVKNRSIQNVAFVDVPQGLEAVAHFQSLADVLVLPTKKGAAMTSIPSKLIAYMFSAKPIIALVDRLSDTANAIYSSGGGWVGEPEKKIWLVAKFKEINDLPIESLQNMGRLAQEYGIKHYSKQSGINKNLHLIDTLIPSL
jgi:glycosyltransferase involved in cell wall biosynthesis